MPGVITVIGGGGRIGRLVVSSLLRQNAEVRVLSRNPDRARRALPDGAAILRGDVRDAGSLAGALRDAVGVVFSVEPGTAGSGPDRPETTMYQGVRNVLAAASSAGARPRFVLVSQIYVTRADHPFNRQYNDLLYWRLRGEDAIRSSGLPYTIVRPAWLTDEPGAVNGIRFEQGDTGDGSVSRADVAQACTQAFTCPSAEMVTFEMYNDDSPPPGNWEDMFSALKKDSGELAERYYPHFKPRLRGSPANRGYGVPRRTEVTRFPGPRGSRG